MTDSNNTDNEGKINDTSREEQIKQFVSRVMIFLPDKNPGEDFFTIHETVRNGKTILEILPERQKIESLASQTLKEEYELEGEDVTKAVRRYINENLYRPPINITRRDWMEQQKNGLIGDTTVMVTPVDNPLALETYLDNLYSHTALAKTIEMAGGKVDLLAGREHPGSPIETWTRDTYIKVGDKIYFPDNSTGEYSAHNTWMNKDIQASKKYLDERNIEYVQTKVPFQGGDILVDETRKTIFYGRSLNSENDAYNAAYDKHAEELQKDTGYTVIPIERNGSILIPQVQVNGQTEYRPLYHLDLFMAKLPNDKLLIFPEGVTAESYEKIQKVYGPDIVKIESGEHEDISTNAKFVGNTMITTKISDRLKELLASNEINAIASKDVGSKVNFTLVDSGPHCLTNELPKSKQDVESDPHHGLNESVKSIEKLRQH